MIDSSGTVEPTGGFDLERARGLRDFLQDDCAEVGDVWGEMIAEIERLRARDRQAAAAIVAMAEGAKQHVLKTHTIMKNVFDEADSLAGYCEELENIVITKDARIKELEADNQNLVTLNKSLMNNDWILRDNNRKYRKRAQKAELLNKELKADLEQSERVVEARLDVIDQQAAKIRELEDAHKRSGEKYAKIINELQSSVYANIPGLKKQWDEILNAPANDKIGPDANPHDHTAEFFRPNKSPAKSWQITEERKAAIKELSELLTAIGCPSCHYYIQKNYGEDITVLRGMLEEADHDKP